MATATATPTINTSLVKLIELGPRAVNHITYYGPDPSELTDEEICAAWRRIHGDNESKPKISAKIDDPRAIKIMKEIKGPADIRRLFEEGVERRNR